MLNSLKIRTLGIMLTSAMATSAFAQNTSVTEIKTERDASISSQGIRLGLVKPSLEGEINLSAGGEKFRVKEAVDTSVGLSIGYAYLPIKSLGWTANFSYMEVNEDSSPASLVRIDGNLAYAFNRTLNLKTGLNLSQLRNTRSDTEFTAGFGFQAGLGVQITRNVGLDLGYTRMNMSADERNARAELAFSGAEVGVNATF